MLVNFFHTPELAIAHARLKDEFGGRVIYYRGHDKVMCHLMFGLVAQTADQLMRLII